MRYVSTHDVRSYVFVHESVQVSIGTHSFLLNINFVLQNNNLVHSPRLAARLICGPPMRLFTSYNIRDSTTECLVGYVM